jgi:polygalacturonase
LTGKVHFRSNVNLHLEKDAVLEFTDEKEDYLPAVHTTWEGVECWNTSPLIYAYGCENVAITGPGMLTARVEGWFARAEPKKGTPEYEKRRPAMKNAWLTQYLWGATNAALSARNLLKECPGAELRPQFIQMNRCRNVLLEGFTLRNSPFWCIHIYLCQNVIARRLDLRARKHNNDGFDIDMTSEVLIEDCVLDNADDGFTMKAGRNQDAWRLNTPTRNVVVRNCHVKFAHTLLGLGSELSGGLENISLHDCTAEETYNFCFLKTNERRGGFVKNIHMSNVSVKKTFMVLSIDTDVMYQYRDFPTFAVKPTVIDGIRLDGIASGEALVGLEVKGDRREKVKNLSMKNVKIAEIKDSVQIGTWRRTLPPEERGRPIDVRNVENMELESLSFD